MEFVVVSLSKDKYLSPFFDEENDRFILPYKTLEGVKFKTAKRYSNRATITPSKTVVAADDLILFADKTVKIKGTEVVFDKKTIVE